jgi:(1->4)-alpha-D-glucan 1-alpha-D-glucosylmutase
VGGPLVEDVSVGAVPISTYRVQFGPQFRFTDGAAIVPYLDALGAGQLYASPYFRARSGSTHGYDVVDHTRFNPEIGDEAEHRAMIDALHARGMGHLVDFVPNHMGIGTDNPWWYDILTWGSLSPYSHFFDIEWHRNSTGRGKVILPVLGDHYGRIVERGELTVGFDAATDTLTLHYFDHLFPLTPPTYGMVLAFAAHDAPPETALLLRELGASFAALRGRPREAVKRTALRDRASALRRELADRIVADVSFARALADGCAAFVTDPDRLDALAGAQHYHLAYWRVSSDEINYRRFFDINDLAGLRVEDAEVLARTHELVFAMIADERIQGLRIDHIDGLYNPGGYANLLVDRSAALGQPLYLVVEKILLGTERLRPDWRIAGTTGYDFMNLVAGLFVDPQAERGFDRIYRRVIGRATTFADEAYEAKRRVMRIDLASELGVLIDGLVRIAHSDRRSRDFTSLGLRRALIEVIAMFPVYRTYVVDDAITPEDRQVIETAVEAARARSEFPDDVVFDFIRDALSAQLAGNPGASYDRTEVLRFAMRFQQYTGPVTAKSLEDTAFYRYVRLVALNEVGGEPARFGRSPEEFHAANAERARAHPHAMLATATHDHKRGEDARLRIAALTEFPAEWSRAVGRWSRMNASLHAGEPPAPSPVDEFLFYQTVVGTLPAAWLGSEVIDENERASYADRLAAYALKAAREAKLRTSWTDRNAGYEAALEAFVRTALAAQAPFFRDACAFTAQVAPLAAVHGLAQVALKLGAPGVPDIYQGCELWDLSLVDPDNRGAVDYARRSAILADFAQRAAEPEALAAELLAAWPDGGIKLYVTWRLLQLRRAHAATFLDGTYRALEVSGASAASIVAFARDEIAFAVPRLARAHVRADLRVVYDDERIALGAPNATYRSVLDGRAIATDAAGEVAANALFAVTPLAVLVRVPGSPAAAATP